MSKPTNYYELATIRELRRALRKVCRQGAFKGVKSTLILKNEQGANIIKARRIKGRILQTENIKNKSL